MPFHSHFLHLHLSKKRRKSILDHVVLVASFLYPMSGLAQVWSVFQGNTAGVAISSWTGFAAFSLLFLSYGIMHKIKPMIITSTCWFIIDSLVIIGALIHRA
jgi:uncharacterized protein with PQ loop repeat